MMPNPVEPHSIQSKSVAVLARVAARVAAHIAREPSILDRYTRRLTVSYSPQLGIARLNAQYANLMLAWGWGRLGHTLDAARMAKTTRGAIRSHATSRGALLLESMLSARGQ